MRRRWNAAFQLQMSSTVHTLRSGLAALVALGFCPIFDALWAFLQRGQPHQRFVLTLVPTRFRYRMRNLAPPC